MKIGKWSLHFYSLPYRREVVWANAIERSGTFALLYLEADNGAVGIAEGTIKPTWSGVSVRSLAAAFEDFIMPKLMTVDVSTPQSVRQALSGIPENRLAKGMADTACWTMRAMAAEKPLWRYMDGTPVVDLTWALTRQAPALMAREAADICGRYGFRTLKIKGGQGFATDEEAIKEIRAAVGEEVILYVDANSAYTRDEAVEYVKMLSELGIAVAEDPCLLLPDVKFTELQAGTHLPILVDRYCTTELDAAVFIDKGARALSAKPGRIGIGEVRDIVALADRHGVKVAIGLYAESALGTLLSLQQAVAVPPGVNLVAAEQTFFLIMTEQVTSGPVTIQDGRIILEEEPDLSRLVDWRKVKEFSV